MDRSAQTLILKTNIVIKTKKSWKMQRAKREHVENRAKTTAEPQRQICFLIAQMSQTYSEIGNISYRLDAF